jgi:hypothetical protein
MKINDCIVCIDNRNTALILGKKYIVYDTKNDSVAIGPSVYYFKTRFKTVYELREEVINKILI